MSDEPTKTWKSWSSDSDPDSARLNCGCVARFVGEIGLKHLQDNLSDPNEWPTADADWDGLAESSKWSCVRVGLKRIQQLTAERDELLEERDDSLKKWNQITTTIAERDAALAEVERLREALNPNPITKQAYSAEFTFTTPHGSVVFVPWTTVKEIMSAIKEHAGIKKQP